MVVGWSMSRQITEELTLEALSQALGRRRPKPDLLHHSDQGGQYAAGDYSASGGLQDHQMICSMSRKGDCWDPPQADADGVILCNLEDGADLP